MGRQGEWQRRQGRMQRAACNVAGAPHTPGGLEVQDAAVALAWAVVCTHCRPADAGPNAHTATMWVRASPQDSLGRGRPVILQG